MNPDEDVQDYYDDVHVTLLPSHSMAGAADLDEMIVIDLPASGAVSWQPGELRRAVKQIARAEGVENYILAERSAEINWGASGGSLEVLLHLASIVGDAAVAYAVQSALKKLLARKGFQDGREEWMDEEEMMEHARHRLAIRYRVPLGELTPVEQSVARDGTGRIVFLGPENWRYEVKLHRARALPSVTEFRRRRPDGSHGTASS